VIEAAVEVVHAASEAKSIQVDTQLDFPNGLVLGDAERLQQVVWNLLSNAIKFTPKGGHVQIRLERNETSVAIAVKDTGEGIDPEFLPHAFDRFRQADASSTRAQGGLGLGLSIVRNLVEMHGGSVRAESPGKGHGATFTVILPVRALADYRDRHPGSLEHSTLSEYSAGTPTTTRLEGMQVLIVDDDGDTRDLLSLALTSAGAEVRACGSASEAMAAIRELKPDCIVSDIGMPGEDGYMLMKKVRELQGKEESDIPAVALTGYAGAEARSRVGAAGFKAYLAKPVALGELISIIIQLVESRSP
jgi:CheY-like chemotaxis protein/anti-sigma regulatory factor (Ser/Thr protein kinase)